MRKLILLTLVSCDIFTSSIVTAYSKVSRNGQARSSSQDIAFTVSPVYVATPRNVELRPGEAVDLPSTPKYSTLDQELLTKLEGITGRQKVQERFHPPPAFEHILAHTNAMRQQQQQQSGNLVGSPSNDDVIYTKPMVSMTYDYPPNSQPINKPSSMPNNFPVYSPSKFPDTYSSGPSENDGPPGQLSEFDNKPPSTFDFDNKPPSTFNFDNPPKSLDFSGTYDHPFENEPSYHPHEIIYDHIPDDHDFHHHHHHHPRPTTTEEPEMMDQRLDKRPYSYYYIGKKLWYIPLYFSIYFIIYIAALVLKSVARHKINFPSTLAAIAAGDNARNAKDSPGWMDYVVKVLDAVEKYGKTT